MSSAAARRLDPDYVALDLTYRCNLACRFCFMSESRAPAARGELPTAALKRLVDRLSQRPRRFFLAGGEPTLRPDLALLVRHIKSRGHFCRLTTNAFLLDEKAAAGLLAAGLDEFAVSLHGAPADHDRLVGVRGAAARIERLFRFVKAYGGAAISAWCTVSRPNHSRLHRAYLYFKSLGADSVMFSHTDYIARRDLARTRAALAGSGLSAALNHSEGLARGVSAAALAREVRRIKAEKDPTVTFFPDLSPAEMKAWYSPRSGFQKRGFCLAQWKGLWIGPRGEVVPCQPLGIELGDASRRPPLEVFNGGKAAGFRRLLQRCGGFLPTCSRCGRASYSSTYCEPEIKRKG